jgi:hypothetical protein
VPLQKLQYRPGVNRESTSLANEGGWYACDKIRFRSGQPENIGGWTFASDNVYLGACRDLTEWESLANSGISFTLLGMGTNLKYYINSNQVFYDITPIADSFAAGTVSLNTIYSTLASSISATSTDITLVSGTSFQRAFPLVITIGSEDIFVQNVSGNTLTGCSRGYNGTTAAVYNSGVAVTSRWLVLEATAHGSGTGNFVTIGGAAAFGPYTAAQLNKNFQIKAFSSNYVAVDVGVLATSALTGQGGAAITAEFEIDTGAEFSTQGAGWGAGVWNAMVYNAGLSTVAEEVDNTETTITLADASTFPTSGYALLESEIIQYSGKSGNDLTGCIRGAPSSTATFHQNGTTIRGLVYQSTTPSATNPVRGWNTPAEFGINIPMRLWSSDSFGQDLVYNIRNGGVYYWAAAANLDPTGEVTLHSGVNITDLPGADSWSPEVGAYAFVSEERHIVVLGTNDPTATEPSAQDPLLLRWCEQEDPLIWEPTPVNTAGFQRMAYGSKLITAEKTRQEVLIWSDSALYSMRYLGPPYTFGFNTISNEVTLAGPNAVVTASNITYWMGLEKFYVYSGRVDTLPCSLRQYVFDDINESQLDQVYAGTNEKFNEVWWFYPSASTIGVDNPTNDRYVVYNYLEKVWYYGQMPRTAWYDSHIRAFPLATSGGRLLLHENGVDDYTTNPPTPVDSFIESSDFDIGEGDNFSFIKRIIPDVDFIGSLSNTPSVTMTVSTRNFPGQGTFTSTDSEVVSSNKVSLQVYDYTHQEWIRLRGRQVAFKISSNSLGVKWQLGVPRIQVQPDGRR